MSDQKLDLFSDEEITKIVKELNSPTVPWVDSMSWLPKKCECGGERANTTHSSWCPKFDNH